MRGPGVARLARAVRAVRAVRVWRSGAAGLLAVIAAIAPRVASAQRPTFAPTLFWESGLINVPAAYASPLGGDLAFNFSRLALDSASLPAGLAKPASYNLSVAASLWGRGEVGISVFSGDLKSGLFGKVVLVDQTDGIWRSGLIHWLPSIAVGIRNVGQEKSLNRLALVNGAGNLNTAPSVYGVATRTFVLAHGENEARPTAQLSLTAGRGTGVFSDDGGLGPRYAKASTGGTFGGASLDFATGRYSLLSLMAEQDGWGVNAGARLEIRGVRVAVYAAELGAGTAKADPAAPSYVSQKVAFTVGWQANILTLVRGNRLEQRAEKLQQEQGDLQRDARMAQQQIDVIEGQIEVLRAISSQEKSAERADLERRLREEQDALRRLQELIKARDAARKPPL